MVYWGENFLVNFLGGSDRSGALASRKMTHPRADVPLWRLILMGRQLALRWPSERVAMFLDRLQWVSEITVASYWLGK